MKLIVNGYEVYPARQLKYARVNEDQELELYFGKMGRKEPQMVTFHHDGLKERDLMDEFFEQFKEYLLESHGKWSEMGFDLHETADDLFDTQLEREKRGWS